MSTKLDFQLKVLVHQQQLELSFFKNVAKTQSVPFPSHKGIRFKVIFILINALYLEKEAWWPRNVSYLALIKCGVWAILKNKKAWPLFHYTGRIVIYKRNDFPGITEGCFGNLAKHCRVTHIDRPIGCLIGIHIHRNQNK